MNNEKAVMVVGSGGQDGRLLVDYFKERGWGILALARGRTCLDGRELEAVDILDAGAVARLVDRHRPARIYHLAAYHHSSEEILSGELDMFRHSYGVNLNSWIHCLEAVRLAGSGSRVFYASSSRVFGETGELCDEWTRVQPACIYGLSKAAGMQAAGYYRTRWGIPAYCGILFNHESKYRRAGFLSKKVVAAALAIRRGGPQRLEMADPDAGFDMSYAPDFIGAMDLLLERAEPGNYVFASGTRHTAQELAETAFGLLGLDWRQHTDIGAAGVRTRPAAIGNPARLLSATGWRASCDFSGMVRRLIEDEGGGGLILR